MKIAVVTGSRDWRDRACLYAMLDAFQPALVIHGDCPTGADRMAHEWAEQHSVLPLPIAALWSFDGAPAAGPIRNSEVVTVAKILARQRRHEVCVFAFPLPKGTGTQDCVRKAKRAELSVVEVKV